MASVADVVAVQQPRAAFPQVAALDFLATEGAPGEIFGSAIGHHNEFHHCLKSFRYHHPSPYYVIRWPLGDSIVVSPRPTGLHPRRVLVARGGNLLTDPRELSILRCVGTEDDAHGDFVEAEPLADDRRHGRDVHPI